MGYTKHSIMASSATISLSKFIIHSFLLFMAGLSVGIVSALCFKDLFSSYSFPFTVPASFSSFSIYSSSEQGPPLPPPLHHNMTDDELLRTAVELEASLANKTSSSEEQTPKVAFMFLTPGPLPLAPLWEKFFEGHETLYSIYIHAHPEYNLSLPETSIFHGRTISNCQPVYWGDISLIDAERRLLANALLDPSNQRFVLLSDSCIPLFNFTTTYDYLINSNLSFLKSYDDPSMVGRGRYNRKMAPTITLEQWRKSSQWFEIHRVLAAKVIADNVYYPLFKNHCSPLNKIPCYSDEHYIPTMVNVLCPELSSNRTTTFVDWSLGGPHPKGFGSIDVNMELIDWIRFGSDEKCVYNGVNSTMCYLFARKFFPNATEPLLQIASSLLS